MMGIGRKNPETGLVLGAHAKANLLPPEVGQFAKARANRRGLAVFVVGTLVVTGIGFGFATVHSLQSQGALLNETNRTGTLLAQQLQFKEVRTVNNGIKNATAARQVGSSTSIDWQLYIQSIQNSLPAGTEITTFGAKEATPLAAFTQPSLPLQGERIAELTFVATSPSLPDVQSWLDSLAKLTGFVDALPGTVTLSTTNDYQVGITMHINELALENRYAPTAAEKAAADKAAAAASGKNSSATAGSAAATASEGGK